MIPQQYPVITVDGASGTGKGTVSLLLAKRLGWKFLDSGVLYRVLALAADKHQIALNDANALEALAQHLKVKFVSEANYHLRIMLENDDVTETIRTEKVGNAASIVGTIPGVRKALLERQRAFSESPGLIADGRDMGTVVFPDARLKIFLIASPEERAKRRCKQLNARGISVTLVDLIQELRERDRRDEERPIAPLKPAADAVSIDTDRLTVEQVVERIMLEIEKKGLSCYL